MRNRPNTLLVAGLLAGVGGAVGASTQDKALLKRSIEQKIRLDSHLPEFVPRHCPQRIGITKLGWRKDQSVARHKERMRRQRRNR